MRIANKIRVFLGHWPKFEISEERKQEIRDAIFNGKPGGLVEVNQEELEWLWFTKNGTLQEPISSRSMGEEKK